MNYPRFDQEPEKPSNAFAAAGFALSLFSLVVCGIFSPIALILCLVGLLYQPKKLAIVGTVISGISTILVIAMVWSIYSKFSEAFHGFNEEYETRLVFEDANRKIVKHYYENGQVPDDVEGDKLIEEDPTIDPPQRYEMLGREVYRLTSAGEDGVFDTDDDVSKDYDVDDTLIYYIDEIQEESFDDYWEYEEGTEDVPEEQPSADVTETRPAQPFVPPKKEEPQITTLQNMTQRTWTSHDGSFTSEATLVSYDKTNDRVELRRPDDSKMIVPMSQLSLEDQGYVRGKLSSQ
ncbi:SHD1 domain-containing protein [Bremerella sp. T1]|uniref:SHD1 domain-containing protein n=1 Tax=Bremerella sp. TYQ1 TaxID=3119568 RepID=UPI001CCF403C|nr:SHD1 domain-containing protein [Bremerella volcania]UBM38445.1 hypothetical protein LA756_11225 [Bremerella volcania]